MANTDQKFRHDSLQDRKSISTLLDAITKGIGKGELSLSDGDNEICLPVDGLLTLRVKAERSDENCRIDLRISWSEDAADIEKRPAPSVK